MHTVPLDDSHLEEACALFLASFRRQASAVPELDPGLVTPDSLLPKLKGCLARGSGAAAFEHEKLVGFMVGMYLDEFLGPHKGVYCPEWGSAAAGDAFDVHRTLYRAAGRRWVGDGCITHAFNFLDTEKETIDAAFWNGFGAICVDAIRRVKALDASVPPGLEIAPMGEADIPEWLPMVEAQSLHMADSPTFLPHLEPETGEGLRKFLGKPGNRAWIARLGGDPVGYMRVAPVADGAAWVVNGRAKFAVNGAYVDPKMRGRGVAGALLSALMAWGLENGMERCSVDFEASNPEACGLWLRHFKPVCRSVVRRLDERIL